MFGLVLSLIVTAEAAPRYLGGAEPTPLNQPAATDPSPSAQACTVETLRLSVECYFDAQPMKIGSESARKKQAQANTELALGLANGICQRRQLPTGLDAKERSARISACGSRVAKATEACSLDGTEVLLDAEGRFAKSAKRCYGDIAAALQGGDVPSPPRSEPADSRSSSGAKPIKI